MKPVKNIPASVRQRLLNHSRERGESFTDILLLEQVRISIAPMLCSSVVLSSL